MLIRPGTLIQVRGAAGLAGEGSYQDWTTNLCVGSLDAPAEARVTCHIHADTQLPWYRVCEGLPRSASADEAAMLEFLRG